MFKIKLKYKLVETAKYNDFVNTEKMLVDLLVGLRKENAALKKVCQCRECKFNGKWYEFSIMDKCYNALSDNYNERMNPYGSCEKCERK